MIRIRFFLIIALFFFCSPLITQVQAAPLKKGEKLKVVTSFTVIADMVRHVAGDAADVESITKPGAAIHDYQPTPKDIVKTLDADLILWNGLNLERWYERFMNELKGVPGAIVTEGIQPLSIYEGPYSGKPNPHAWMSLTNGLIYVENIKKALTEHDPGNREIYERNAASYEAQIKALHEEILEELKNVPVENRYLVTSEGAFSYLARDLDFKDIYLWPINAEQQGNPQQVRAVIDQVRARHIPVVFSESTVSDRPARQVASETGARYGGVLYVDSLSDQNGPVPTYLDMLRVTSETIIKGFKDEQK